MGPGRSGHSLGFRMAGHDMAVLYTGTVYPLRWGIGGGGWGDSIEPWMHVSASINQHRWLRTPDGSAAPCVMCRRMRARCTLRRCTCWRLETDRKRRRCTGAQCCAVPPLLLSLSTVAVFIMPLNHAGQPSTLTFSSPTGALGSKWKRKLQEEIHT